MMQQQPHPAFGATCGCKIQCSSDLGCPNPVTAEITYPLLKDVDGPDKEVLRARLKDDTKNIMLQFYTLVSKFFLSLKDRDVALYDIKTHLMELKAFDDGEERRTVFHEQEDKLKRAATLNELFEVIKRFCSFFNHDLLRYLINSLGSDDEKTELETYETKFQEYAKRKVYESPTLASSTAEQTNVYVKLESRFSDDYSLVDLQKFRIEISKILKVSPYVMRLCCVEKGCMLTFQIPRFVEQRLFPLTSEQERCLVQRGGIQRLTCGNYEHQNEHFPVCIAVDSDEEENGPGDLADNGVVEMSEGDVQSAWAYKNVIWRGRKELRVKFLNDIPHDWKLGGRQLNEGNIMSWASEWSLRGEGVLPMFIMVEDPNDKSDIRIKFTKGKTQSMIGNKAKNADRGEPTMWLNLHSGGIDDSFKKYLVVHEFGHALGLGHEHQRSDFWKILKRYLNEAEMKEDLSVGEKKFKHDWGGDQKSMKGKATPYDSGSVMHYWFKKSWLKPPYHDREKILEDSQPGGRLSEKVAKVLLGVHDRDADNNPPPTSPSEQDIQLLKKLYGSEKPCTIMGPPPPIEGSVCGKANAQDPKKVTIFLLSNLKSKCGNQEKINIIRKVAPEWRQFALHLDFDNDGTTVQTIDQKCRSDPEKCCAEMMTEWLKGKGSRQPVTWELLVEILDDCELKVLAKEVKEAVSID